MEKAVDAGLVTVGAESRQELVRERSERQEAGSR
jgi:hypothetical protein